MGNLSRKQRRAIAREQKKAVQRAGPDQQSGPAPMLVGQSVNIQSYTGSMVPPEFAAQWEQLVPGSADRILTSVEQQMHHRHGLETKVVDAQVSAASRGQWLAFLLGLAAFGFAGFALYLNKDPYAIGGIVSGVGLLIANFWNQRRKVDSEMVDKRARDLLRESGYEPSPRRKLR